MNKTCKEIQNELIHSGTKISQSDFLKICEKYNLSLIEVDELSKSISDLQLFLNDNTESTDEDELIKALKGCNLPYIDNRPKNGVLWIITRQRIADENGVNDSFVKRAEQFSKGVDAAEEAVPGTRQKVLSGEVKPTAAEIASVARAPPEERPALVAEICKPKEPKKSSSKSTSKSKKVEKSTTSTVPCEVQAEPPVIEVPPEPIIQSKQKQTALQTIRTLSTKMESVEQVADAEGMLSEVASAADSMIYRLDVCFEHYPEFLKNPKIRQKVVGLLQKAKDYIVKLEGEFA